MSNARKAGSRIAAICLIVAAAIGEFAGPAPAQAQTTPPVE